jgi:hypothetical protein
MVGKSGKKRQRHDTAKAATADFGNSWAPCAAGLERDPKPAITKSIRRHSGQDAI